jgi:hypothetical protein
LGLNVTVFELAVHTACNVNGALNVNDAPFACTTDPPELVAHPANVYPVLANAFDVNAVATSVVIDCVVSDPPPTKFDLNVTVFELAVHLA